MKEKTKAKSQCDIKDEPAAGNGPDNSGVKWTDAAAKAQEELDKNKVIDDQASSCMKEHAAG